LSQNFAIVQFDIESGLPTKKYLLNILYTH